MPACFSRAPVHKPGEAAADERDRHLVEARLALDPLDVGIVEEVGEAAGRLEVLVVAVGPQPLVALLAVPGPQRLAIDRHPASPLALRMRKR